MFPKHMTVHESLLMPISFVLTNSFSEISFTKTYTVTICVLPSTEAQICTRDILDFLNLLTPNVSYTGRTAPLTSKGAFYIFIQQI